MAHDVMVGGRSRSLASTTAAFIKSLPDGGQLSRPDDKTLISKTSPTVWEYDIFRMEWTRRSVLRYLFEMLREDPLTFMANKKFAETAVQGGFDLRITSDVSQKEADKAQIILDDLIRRARFNQKIYSWTTVLLRDGDLFLNPVVDPNTRLIRQVKSLPAISMQRNDDITGNFPDLNQAFQQIDPLSLQPLLELALWQVNHIRWNYEDGQRYGRSQYLTCLQTWRKLNMTQQDLVIRRRTRAAPKRVHLVGGKDQPASPDEIDAYIERNKVNGSHQDVITDFYLSGQGDIKDLNADAQLDHIADIEYLQELHVLGTGVPLALMGFGQNINRDVVEDQKKQFDEDVERLRATIEGGDGGTYSGIRAMLDLQLALQEIDPSILEYNIIWHERDDESPSDRAKRVLALRAAVPGPMISERSGLRIIGRDIGLDNDDSIDEELELIKQEVQEDMKQKQAMMNAVNPPGTPQPQDTKPATDSTESQGATENYRDVDMHATGNNLSFPLHSDPRLGEMEEQIKSRVKGLFGTMAEHFITSQKKQMAHLANMQPTLATGLDSVMIPMDTLTHAMLHGGQCSCVTDATQAQIHANAQVTPLMLEFAANNKELAQLLKQLLGDLYTDIAPIARSNVMNDVKRSGAIFALSPLLAPDMDVGHSPLPPNITDDMKMSLRGEAAERADMILDTTRKMLGKALTDVLEAPERATPEVVEKAAQQAINAPDWRIQMIARTELANAYNRNVIHAYKDLGVDNLKWITVMDDKTCKECKKRNGQIYPIDDIPTIPAHPNCRCHVVGVPAKRKELSR